MCVFVGVCVCVYYFACVCCYATRTTANKVLQFFHSCCAAVMLLSVWIFSLCSFSVALKRQSMLGLKIDSLSNVNDDDISRIVFAKLYAMWGE